MRTTEYTCNACGKELDEGLLVEVNGPSIPYKDYFQHYCSVEHMLQKLQLTALEPTYENKNGRTRQTEEPVIRTLSVKWTYLHGGVQAGPDGKNRKYTKTRTDNTPGFTSERGTITVTTA